MSWIQLFLEQYSDGFRSDPYNWLLPTHMYARILIGYKARCESEHSTVRDLAVS